MRRLLTGNGAAAWGARLANVDYLPAFPITPQTEVIETLSGWIDRGELDATMTMLESEHSMITAAGSAAATGARTFTATSSQGLLYAMEMVFAIPGWRAPLVLVNVSRALASPVTLEPDHNDVLAARDSGFIQLHAASCQEVLDFVLIGHCLSEHPEVRLPVIVNLDGFYLSFTREPVELPVSADGYTPNEALSRSLPPRDEPDGLRAGQPQSLAVAVLGGSQYSYFRYQMHLASLHALEVFDEVTDQLQGALGRRYTPVERYRCDGASIALLMIGSFATKAKEAVDRLREQGIDVGLVRPRMLRPFPRQAIRDALGSMRAVAVIDQNLSVGWGGVLEAEVAASLYGLPRPPLLASFIGGLGGRDIDRDELFEIVRCAARAAQTGQTPAPRLLYRERELEQIRALQKIAQPDARRSGADDAR